MSGAFARAERGSLVPGHRLGRYEIVAPIGAGGMGEVYKARDTRLGRDVAIKVLPAQFASDPERLRRFEQEARAVAALSHPNILAVFDVGSAPMSFRVPPQRGEESAVAEEVVHYLVSELLEGESLRERLRAGGLTVRKAVETAIQIAQGLAAAHEKGIVHRDLKPANVFITKDGHVKILDFGIAKLTWPDPGPHATTLTPEPSTETGALLGTAGYMSPEQVRGLPTDQRTDIFSFGCVLYEMLSGRAPFRKDTTAETMTAILHEEPAELGSLPLGVSPALERAVKRCLEKEPGQRFSSAHDLALALEIASATSGTGRVPPSAARRPRWPWVAASGALGIVVGAAIGGALLLQSSPRSPEVRFTPLTFRRGWVGSARFTSDGQTVVYSASWDGAPSEVYAIRLGSPESASLGYAKADLLAVAPNGELALRLAPESPWLQSRTTFAAAPFSGGTPRELDDSVYAADYSPDGRSMAVARTTEQGNQAEYPIGTSRGTKVLGPGPARIVPYTSLLRVSPDGGRVAYFGVNQKVVVADSAGAPRTLASGGGPFGGLAWSPGGRELWFTGGDRTLRAVTLSGRQRVVYSFSGPPSLQDIAGDGRLLVTMIRTTTSIRFRDEREAIERDLTWLDRSLASDLSADGRTVAFFESEAGVGKVATVFLRDTSGAPPVKLGPGMFPHFSADGRFVAAALPDLSIVVYPVASGTPRTIQLTGFQRLRLALPLPGGAEVCLWASEPSRGERIWVTDLTGSNRRPISPEGIRGTQRWLTPDRRFAVAKFQGATVLYPVAGGDPVTLKGVAENETIAAFTEDGSAVFAYDARTATKRIYRVDVQSGKRAFVREIGPADLAGTGLVATAVLMTSDGQRWIYTPDRWTSELYLVEGLK